MKTKLLSIAVMLALTTGLNAQITLENTYNASQRGFYPVKLAASGDKYAVIDGVGMEIRLYNLNHSIFKTMPLPNNLTAFNFWVLFISEALFDLDSTDVEYMVQRNDTGFVSIYDENGAILFNDTAYATLTFTTIGTPIAPIWTPIAVTDSGTKMILHRGLNQVKVYSLPGTLPSGSLPMMIDESGSYRYYGTGELSWSYPNPSKETAKINYKLPQGANQGEIVFYSLNGTVVKRFKVDRSFKTLLLNNSDLAPGTYLYNLVTSKNVTKAKKMIVIK